MFTLVVDDFGIKYTRKEDADYFLSVLAELYELKVNWKGDKYLGFTIEFNDELHTLSLSMPGYVEKLIKRFYPTAAPKGAASPAIYMPPSYGVKGPQPAAVDDSTPLQAHEILRLQEIIGSVLFYARAVDCTMLPAINHISSEQSKPTQRVMDMAIRVLE